MDPDQLASLVISVDPDQLASEELNTFVLVQGQVNRNFQLVLDEMGPCRTSPAWYFHSPVYLLRKLGVHYSNRQ